MAYDIEEETRSVFSLSETSPGFLPVGHYSGNLFRKLYISGKFLINKFM